MKKLFCNIICAFIFNKEKRKAFRARFKPKKQRLSIPKGNVFLSDSEWVGEVKISGSGNRLFFKKNSKILEVNIRIFGNNNIIELGENVICSGTEILIGEKDCCTQDASISIGSETTFGAKCSIRAMEHHSKIHIGEDVMCSDRVYIWATDTHAILDESGTLKNHGKEIIIGQHSWIGMDAKIGKNVNIGEGSIVGWGSVVPSGIYPAKSLLAGNPASVRKSGIFWSRARPNVYMEQT